MKRPLCWPELEFVLVMNGEGLEPQVTFEGARDWLTQHFRCRYVYLPTRIGYVRALDWGWKLAEPEPDDYVAVLNDDVEITGDWITPLVEALREYPGWQVGPSLMALQPDGFGRRASIRCVGGPRIHYHYLEGWCWMARAETITRAGGIVDLGFEGSYCEDCDLSIRIRESGGNVLRVPCTLSDESNPIRHIGHQSSSPEMMQNWAKNRQYLAEKWDLTNGGLRVARNS
jgi:hypothetical protein